MDIRDSKNNLVGRINQQGSDTVLRDHQNNMLGRVSNGVAYDPHGNKLGNAGMLGTLIPKR